MNLQQIQSEVSNRVQERTGDILALVIRKQLDILDNVPGSFSSYDEYVEWALVQYTQAKILLHKTKKIFSYGCGSSMSPFAVCTSTQNTDIEKVEDLVHVCRERYYKAIGKKTNIQLISSRKNISTGTSNTKRKYK